MATTFISYRREDAAGYAGRLHEALEDRLGRNEVFRDVDTLEPGRDFIDAIERRLRECRVFLALIGRGWLDSRDTTGRRRLDQPNDFVRLEIMTALARPDVLVVPVLIEGASMPAPESVPGEIRAITRRHALHLRDDVWDHDVERLAGVIKEATSTAARVSPSGPLAPLFASLARSRRRMIGIAAAVALLAWFLTGREAADRSSSTTDAAAPGVANGTAIGSGSAGSSTAGARGQPYGVPVPAVAEAAHSQLIYTLLSAAVIPLGNDTSELRLRFRFSNEGGYPANAWDSSFRLVTGNETLAPTGGLNDLVAGHSLKQGIVVFTIPASTGRAVLRVVENTRVADIPLDLSPTGRPAEDEKADAGDALSRAIIRSVLSEPRELVSDRAGGLSVTLTRGTTRRFANVLRVRFALRYAYAGNYSTYTGAATLRIAAGDQLMAPIEEPSEALGAQSTVSADMEFELPPDTKRAVLRGTIGKTTAEWAFDVPQ